MNELIERLEVLTEGMKKGSPAFALLVEAGSYASMLESALESAEDALGAGSDATPEAKKIGQMGTAAMKIHHEIKGMVGGAALRKESTRMVKKLALK